MLYLTTHIPNVKTFLVKDCVIRGANHFSETDLSSFQLRRIIQRHTIPQDTWLDNVHEIRFASNRVWRRSYRSPVFVNIYRALNQFAIEHMDKGELLRVVANLGTQSI